MEAKPYDLIGSKTTTRSVSTPISSLQSNPEELTQQFNFQPEVEVRAPPLSDPASGGRNRRRGQPKVLTDHQRYERQKKKIARDKAYRDRNKQMKNAIEYLKKIKPEYDRLINIASKFGGIDEMESRINRMDPELVEAEMFQQLLDINQSHCLQLQQKEKEAELHQFEQMKFKYGGILEMKSMLEKFKEREAELHKLEQMKSKFGGLGEMESMLEKFKDMELIGNVECIVNRFEETELQHDKLKKRQRFSPLPTSPCGLQEDQHYGAYSMNLNNQGSTSTDEYDWMSEISQMICRMSPATARMPDKQYSNVLVEELIDKLDEEVRSKVSFSSFNGLELDEERERVGGYNFPPSLVSTVNDIINVHRDITEKSFHGPSSIETTFILFAAAIKEMGDIMLIQVTEETLFKWRDAIKDALRSKFTVEFAMEHLKKIGYAFYGLKACDDLKKVQQSLTNFIAEEKSLREELQKKENEIKALKDMEEELTSGQSKICQNYANHFLNRTVGLF